MQKGASAINNARQDFGCQCFDSYCRYYRDLLENEGYTVVLMYPTLAKFSLEFELTPAGMSELPWNAFSNLIEHPVSSQ